MTPRTSGSHVREWAELAGDRVPDDADVHQEDDSRTDTWDYFEDASR